MASAFTTVNFTIQRQDFETDAPPPPPPWAQLEGPGAGHGTMSEPSGPDSAALMTERSGGFGGGGR
jgi:hypothetical protein